MGGHKSTAAVGQIGEKVQEYAEDVVAGWKRSGGELSFSGVEGRSGCWRRSFRMLAKVVESMRNW